MAISTGEIAIQRAVPARGIPAATSLRAFARAALPARHGELTIRIVDLDESRALNRTWRGKDKPTNVLSFAGSGEVLGDLVICAPVVASEAAEQGKTLRAHWAHMVVHGCLHLCGYDHERDDDARRMEAREISILKKLGFANPYR
ncbi:probable rRNA maturation factor [Fontimonas thermophila]|uniref:Endoribonuclease YbeY n=1 Tax=Fontimonas thermophila TaxID=1076937 RepID=A0A1I2K0V2_9GAMM|nr:rRNA maturation RNase YbeY [Fontimonas thermophila]SFF58646.1 probable rRNA maturation factor [Fontimonas thermophila]